MCVDGEFLLVASAFRAPDIFGRFMICNDTSPNIVRHSVGGYHRSLSRSKPEFESPWRNNIYIYIYLSFMLLPNSSFLIHILFMPVVKIKLFYQSNNF